MLLRLLFMNVLSLVSLATTEMMSAARACIGGVLIPYTEENPAPTTAALTSLVVRKTVVLLDGPHAGLPMEGNVPPSGKG